VRSSSLQFAPFSGIDVDSLIHMAGLPVAWSDFIFALHQEVASRDFLTKEIVLKKLQESYLAATKIEASLAIAAMEGKKSERNSKNILNRDAFSKALTGGQYVPVIKTIITSLVQPVTGVGDLIDQIPQRPNKKSVAEFVGKVIEIMTPYEPQFVAEQVWIFELVKKFYGVPVARSSKSVQHQPGDLANLPKRLAAVAPYVPETWKDSAIKIRHAKVHEKAQHISQHRGDNNWADVSPLKMLGYSVDAKDGLNEKDRREFLVDFCDQMILPLRLPRDYVEPWGDPGTKKRILRTAKHLAFVRRNFARQDQEKFARAIACWQSDFNFLQLQYVRMQISSADWAAVGKG
jgi:hypothetical protein